MERFISLLVREWGVIKQAPVTFALILIFSLGIAFSLSQFLFSHIVAEKDATIQELENRPTERTEPELTAQPTAAIESEVQATPTASASSLAPEPPHRANLPYDESLTPDYLVGLYKGRTDVQGDTLANRYIEKWEVGMKGRIAGVYSAQDGSGGLVVMLQLRETSRVQDGSSAFADFSNTSPDLATVRNLKMGDQISVMGPLEDVNRQYITLRDCEIVWIGKEPKQK
jgi:hypothetical protein